MQGYGLDCICLSNPMIDQYRETGQCHLNKALGMPSLSVCPHCADPVRSLSTISFDVHMRVPQCDIQQPPFGNGNGQRTHLAQFVRNKTIRDQSRIR